MKTAILNAVIDLNGAECPSLRDKKLIDWYSDVFNNTEVVEDCSGSGVDNYIIIKEGVLAPSVSNSLIAEKLLNNLNSSECFSLNGGRVIICTADMKESHEDAKPVSDDLLLLGIQDYVELNNCVVNIQLQRLYKKGVTVENPSNFYLSEKSEIGENVLIGSGVVIKGNSTIGANAAVGSNTLINDSNVAGNCTILHGSVVNNSRMEENAAIGPYTHLRTDVVVCRNAKAGNFVEMKKTVFGEGSKAMHLAYLGDAEIGRKVNIGAGTITCNYDGKNKNVTKIGDGVFVGSDSQLVAPVELQDNAYVAAGSTITEDVSRGALAISRVRQREIPGWSDRKKLSD